ncbi:hypothetical protein HID58_076895 [Brassica napus]|uniref:Protein arginine methyltransferase NDUFAF7, mitochondrial n=3 Tax=Brassica TaxID=3705 RepID=A0A816MU34_BRANA|nr:hypothetical protein HID58_076895 [Brassica napus]CAF2007571.1 unnamed protein product [Brassica napus]VDD38721.1 unnamed protein product [Brassica oleracea]
MLRRLLTQTSSRRLLSSKTPFFSKPSLSPFSSLPSSPDPPSSASSHVEESGSSAAAGTTISVDRSGLFNPPDHSHEPTPDSELVKHLKSVIKFRGGPISVAEYMEEVLTNPRSGYYMNRDVFGAQGDFITSPEVSQMFGEMIGVWTVCLWEQMGKPERVNLIELGPGRGTLMVDLLRGTSKFRNFTESLHIHLVECSPALQKLQHQNLKCTDESSSEKKAISSPAGTPVHWHATLEEVPSGVPTIIIAHEFYDALPVHQFQKSPRGWCEKMVDVGEDSQFRFVLSPQPTPAALYLVKRCTWATPEEKEKLEHVEISPKSMDLTQEIAKRIGSDGGGALIIDYGKDGIISDSLQAIREHKFVNILDDPGSADLSAYVDFPSIKHSAEEASENVSVHGPMTQSQFLGSLGINFRVDALLQNCDDEQAESLRSGYWRLVGDGEAPFWEGPDEQTPIGMGERYLAMAIVNRNQGTPAPFQSLPCLRSEYLLKGRMYGFEALTFNIHGGYLEAIVRGHRAGLLTTADYNNLCQCENLDDIKMHLSATKYGSYLQNEPSPLHTTTIVEKCTLKLVDDYKHMLCQATEPMSTFLEYIRYGHMIDNVVLIVTGTLHERDVQELIEKCHPLGMFDSIATLAVAQNMRELYRLVLVDTPLAPYFSECLTSEDLDDMNIEIMRNTLYKAYLEDFYKFCQKLGGATSEIMSDLLAFEADRRAVNITINSIGTELTREDRKKLYSNFGLLYPYGHEELAICEDIDQVRGVMEKYPPYQAIFSKMSYGESQMLDKAFYEEEVRRLCLAFEQQFHYGVFFAYMRLREQEIRNLMWISECVAQNQKSRIHDSVVYMF